MIYLVTQGEFDDYEIVHVFSDEEPAAEHVERHNAAWPRSGSMERRVEIHEVLTEAPKMAVLCHSWWSPSSGKGVQTNEHLVEVDAYASQTGRLTPRQGNDGFWYMSFDSERAIKIVSDARAKHLAQAAGL